MRGRDCFLLLTRSAETRAPARAGRLLATAMEAGVRKTFPCRRAGGEAHTVSGLQVVGENMFIIAEAVASEAFCYSQRKHPHSSQKGMQGW